MLSSLCALGDGCTPRDDDYHGWGMEALRAPRTARTGEWAWGSGMDTLVTLCPGGWRLHGEGKNGSLETGHGPWALPRT